MSENDNLTNVTLIFDENFDGELDNVIEYKENEQGKICEVSLDYDKDGTADLKIFYIYDNVGRLYKKYIDSNLDGKIDSIQTFVFDENGKVTIEYDDNADGKVDYIEFENELGKTEIKDVRDIKTKLENMVKDIFKK